MLVLVVFGVRMTTTTRGLGAGVDADQARELSRRWSGARLSALRFVLGAEVVGPERALVEAACEVAPVETMRRVFENSQKLGLGFSRLRGQPLTRAELPQWLSALESPCLAGAWRGDAPEAVLFLERRPCAEDASPAFCDYWREAIDGLASGLGPEHRHTRHSSRGRGGESCVDVLYSDPEHPVRFGVLPEQLVRSLEGLRRLVAAFRGGASIEFLGVSENVLLYRLASEGCAGPPVGLRAVVDEALRKKLPALRFKELSPRSVFETAPESTTRHEEMTR